MIVVQLQGGLGNQMFQYALGRAVAAWNGDELALDLTLLLDRTPRSNFVYRNYDLDIFWIEPKFTFLSRLARRAPVPILYFGASRAITFLKDAFKLQKHVSQGAVGFFDILKFWGNLYLDGYWQSEKYFESVSDEIRRDFLTLRRPSPRSAEMSAKISAVNSVCVNVRRADFVSLKGSADTHGFLGLEFYREGMGTLARELDRPHFFVFSDEVDWCRENFKFEHPTTFVGHEYAGYKFGDYLKLMSECRHFLIANSSFAWWGAWLGANPEKRVIAPRQWFRNKALSPKDIVPSSWRMIV